MGRFFALLFFISQTWLFILFANTADEYPVAQERQKILEIIERLENEKIPLHFLGMKNRTDQEKEFLRFYRENIFPIEMTARRQWGIYSLLQAALDRALYRDEDEKSKWLERLKLIDSEMQTLKTSSLFNQATYAWVGSEHGLRGELSRRATGQDQGPERAGSFGPSPYMLKRLEELELKINLAANESSVTSNDLQEYANAYDELKGQFLLDSIELEDVKRELLRLWPKSSHAKGHDLLEKAKPLFDEVAVLRTRLAQSKGFETWAQFKLFSSRGGYAEGLKTVSDHVGFMREVLDETLGPAKKFHQHLVDSLGYDPKEVRGVGTELLMAKKGIQPGLANYFLAENANEIWRETMKESGFQDFVLDQIYLDSFPRKNKYTHAYMQSAVRNIPKAIVLDTETFDFKNPPLNGKNYFPGAFFIVQNIMSDGCCDYRTVFHEGGHALDYAHRGSMLEGRNSYAYTETSSMMMERFFEDADYMMKKGRDRKGRSPKREAVIRFLENEALKKSYRTRGQIFLALFDLLIWDEPYFEGGPSFTDRFLQIHDDLQKKYMIMAPSLPPALAPDGVRGGSRFFFTNHFYGGSVRYYGYIYADMAAQMTANYLWDTLEKRSGRRTFYRQPDLARLLIRGQYRDGFTLPFPTATERLTGKKFVAQNITPAINRPLDDFVKAESQRTASSCARLLRKE
ncbi:MAG: M3 family metallopeptidase [Bacteriovoracales bacterium]|nr:M3 family metallopeptidase [Bacteriovoracales bacterium]